jgi:proline-specific peptidase
VIPGYRRIGNGSTLVCHPGGPGFSSAYFGDLAGLDSAFDLVLVDPRGTGGTPAPPDGSYAIDDYVADLEELRQALSLDTLDLLGHSHGGVVAIAYAAHYPGNVRRLVLANSLARFGEEAEQAMAAGIASRAGESWVEDAQRALEDEEAGRYSTPEELMAIVKRELPLYFAHYGERERAWVDATDGERLNIDALKQWGDEILGTFDLRPELGKIDTATLVLTGADDFITGPVCAEELAAGIRGARLVVFENCGHLSFVEQPGRFHAAVQAFAYG